AFLGPRRILPGRRTGRPHHRFPGRLQPGRPARQPQLPLVPGALRALPVHRPHRHRPAPPRRRPRPGLLRRRAELRRGALAAAVLRGLPAERQRPRSALQRQLRFPRGRPADHARHRHPRRHADEGAVQPRLGRGDLRRQSAGRALAAGPRAGRPRPRPGHGDLSPMAANMDYEQAGELKFGQVGIANLRIRKLDIGKLEAEMAERVQRAPKLFARAAVILDFGGLSPCPDAATTRELIQALRRAGVLPVALAYGTREVEALAEAVDLPLLAKFRAQYERAGGEEPAPAPAPAARTPEPAPAAAPAPAPAPRSQPGLIHLHPVRSGQQVYAQDRDLTVCAAVGAGAEVIADGSIHIYGALRGRALAGASGLASARIFCREFHAELVAVAGHYKVLEEIPRELIGKAVQIRLENEKLLIEQLD